MNKEQAQALLSLRQSPYFTGLVEYLTTEIENVRTVLETSTLEGCKFYQGAIAALRGILRDFDDAEMFVKDRDNSSASPE